MLSGNHVEVLDTLQKRMWLSLLSRLENGQGGNWFLRITHVFETHPMATTESVWIILRRWNSTYDTTENFSHFYGDDRLSSKEDGSKGHNQGQTGHHSISITKSFWYITIDHESNDLSAIGTLSNQSQPIWTTVTSSFVLHCWDQLATWQVLDMNHRPIWHHTSCWIEESHLQKKKTSHCQPTCRVQALNATASCFRGTYKSCWEDKHHNLPCKYTLRWALTMRQL